MSEQNLPHPDSPVEEYLGVLCEQPGVEKPAHPSSSVERYLDYLCEHGGGGGASSWDDLEGKPFEEVGTGLQVVDDKLTYDPEVIPDVPYVDDSITATMLYIDQQDASEHAGRVAGDNLINAKIPPQASSTNQLADKDFVNSSINSVSAYPITYNANGDGFPTIGDLTGASTYYSGGAVRVPTTNDYAFVVADTSKATVVSGYASFTTTAQYVDYYVMYNSVATLVTSANKDSVGITPGTTVAYVAIPSTRYVYSIPAGQTSGAWNFQTVVSPISLTAAQIKAINSGITAALVALIATALQGIKIKGVDVTPDSDGKSNIPVMTSATLGVAKVGSGLTIDSNDGLTVNKASDSLIASKGSNYQPIVPGNLDKAVMEGLGNNSLTWSSAYQASARAKIGAAAESDIMEPQIVVCYDQSGVTHTYSINMQEVNI